MPLKISGLRNSLEDKKALRQVREDLVAARSGILFATATYDTASLADGAGATTTVVVPGADLGDFAFCSLGVSLQGITVNAYVSASDTVGIRLQNETAGTIDLASTTIRVFVVKRASVRHVFGDDALYSASTIDVTSLVDAAGSTPTGVTVTGAALGDYVFASHGVDLAGITMTAYVQAADTVELRFQNETAGTIDLASSTTRLVVVPKASLSESFFGRVLQGTATYDAASLADAAGATTTVTVEGASIGDYAFGSVSLDSQDITVTYAVTAADTVTVRFQNEGAGTVDLASLTIRCGVIPHGVISAAGVVGLTK